MQVRYILDSALGPYVADPRKKNNNTDLREIHKILLKEKGLSYLFKEKVNPKDDCLRAITSASTDLDDWLDVVEFCFFCIDCMRKWPQDSPGNRGIEQDPGDAINELNVRFRQAGFGYQFEAGKIVRVDSQLLHSEVTKPALILLGDPRFKGAQEEFLSAHAHYRAGEHEDAILDANRAFESVMKTICDIRGWDYPKGGRASDLITVIRVNGLLPKYLDQSFDQLIATLKSGLPKVRNEAGGHGQGATPRETPGYVAGYALNLAAASILFLVEALKETERR